MEKDLQQFEGKCMFKKESSHGARPGDEARISGQGRVMLRSVILVYMPVVPKLFKWKPSLPLLKALYKQAV